MDNFCIPACIPKRANISLLTLNFLLQRNELSAGRHWKLGPFECEGAPFTEMRHLVRIFQLGKEVPLLSWEVWLRCHNDK
jgi:hypothetical protein